MDVASLAKLFSTTFDANPNARKAGELEIRQAARQEGMLTAVLHIVGSNEMDIATRQAAAIYLKNRVQKSWDNSAAGKKRADYFDIAQSERDALRASIFPLIIASPSPNVTIQLTTTLRVMIADDFPEKWPDMMNTIKTLLGSSDIKEVMAGCTAILEVVKVFRYRQASEVLAQMAGEVFPQLATIAAHLLASPPGPSQDVPTILHMILKSYRNSIVLQLSKHQQSPESIVPWGRLLFQVIDLQIPAEAVPQDEEAREKSEWWKAKKWAYSILGRLFHRYGNPSQLPSAMKEDYGAFAEHFISTFAPEIIKNYLHQVELLVSGQVWLSKKCQYQILQFLTECVKPKATWVLIKPHAQTLVQSFIFPQLTFTPRKQELWESDPVEYTRMSIDQYEDFSDPVSAATSFLYSLASNRTKATFLPILGFINSVLESNAEPQQKFGALCMVSALHHFMLRHPDVRPKVEQFVVQHVFPCFTSNLPYLRAIACEIIADVEKLKIKWTKEENLATVSQAIGNALNDPELPVRVQAALALTELVESHKSVEELVRQQVDKVIQDYLKLADETDLDVLNNSIEVMVETYSEELVPVATQLTTRLADSYLRLLRENMAQEAGADAEMDPSALTGDDDKTFAAMGVIKTIATIITSLGSNKEILAQIQEIVIPIVMFTLDNKQIDLFDNIYELVDSLTFNLRRIDANMWQVLESTYKLFKSDAVDFLDEMLPSLDNFLSYGADVIKASPNFKMMFLDIYTTGMTSEQLGENDRVNASKLIESFLLNLRGEVDDAIPIIVPIALKQLDEANSRALRLANLETLINVVLYNAAAALQCMESHEAGSARKFFDKWFSALKMEHGFPRVHDKKLSIMAMSALLELDPAAVPPTLQEGWVGIVSATLHVFRTLPVAIEKRKALEDAFEGEDEDDEDEDAEPVALEIDDEEGDVWDEDSSYMEFLASEGLRLRTKAINRQSGIEDDEEDDDSDDESEIDEELGFISPLDSVDPYTSFKQALTTFQMKNPAAYQAATTSLDVEQQTLLMEVMTIAEKNSTAAPAA